MNSLLKKLGLVLTIFAALVLATACPGPNTAEPDNTKQYTLTVYAQLGEDGALSAPAKFTVEEGDTLESITDLPAASLEGYDFIGWYAADGSKFGTNTPIKADTTIYARFYKITALQADSSKNETAKTKEETKTTDGSSTETTTTISTNDDGEAVETVVTVETAADKTSTETTDTTTTKDDGSVVKETVTVEKDAEGTATSTTEVTATTGADGKTTVEQTTTDAEGNKVTTHAVTSINADGDTVVTYVDDQGKTVGQPVIIPATAHQLVARGIDELVRAKNAGQGLVAAKKWFDKAYAKYPNDDEAILYSALSDLTSVVTNDKFGKFFKDHLGITNYPKTLEALVSNDWLKEATYKMADYNWIYPVNMTAEDDPDDYRSYYFKGKLADNSDYYAYYFPVQYNGKTYYVDKADKNRFEANISGESVDYMFEFGFHSSIETSARSPAVLCDSENDSAFDCWVRAPYSEGAAKGLTPYEYDSRSEIKYNYTTNMKGPVFADPSDQNWFTSTANEVDYLAKRLLANILKGNAQGLNSAIDDLYEAMFNSNEYKSACDKINSIKASVEVPAIAVEGMGLKEIFGTSKVELGATELRLIKSALDVFKGVFEYIQSYNLNYDLSFFMEHFDALTASVIKFNDEGDSNNAEESDELPPIASALLEGISTYNASLDPLANRFLFARDDGYDKIEASRATFLGIIDSIIASYDSMTGNNSIYSKAIKDQLGEYAVLKEAALALRDAIANGTTFYIPASVDKPETWPTEAADDLWWIDFGHVFSAGEFAIDSLIECDDADATVADMAPVIYYISGYNENDGNPEYKELTSAEELMTYLNGSEEGEGEEGDEEESEMPDLYLNVLAFGTINEVTNIPACFVPMIANAGSDCYMPISAPVGAMLFNFYYGIEDFDPASFFGNE